MAFAGSAHGGDSATPRRQVVSTRFDLQPRRIPGALRKLFARYLRHLHKVTLLLCGLFLENLKYIVAIILIHLIQGKEDTIEREKKMINRFGERKPIMPTE